MSAQKGSSSHPPPPMPAVTDMLERISDAFVALDANWHYVYVNAKAAQLFNRRQEDLIGKHIWTEFPEGIDQPFYKAYYTAAATKQPLAIEEYYPPYDRWFENRIYPSDDGLVIFFQDITERKRNEALARQTNRALTMLGACGEALVRSDDEHTLLKEICRICVEVGGYRLAWVGLAEEDREKSVRVGAEHGFSAGYLESLRLTWSDTEFGRGPTGTAIRTGQPRVAQDILADPLYAPWRDAALQGGYRSSIALPLVCAQHVLGALNIYSAEPNAFSPGEVDSLLKLANNLAFGIEMLRARTQHALMEDQLRESESRYRMLYEQNPAPMAIYERETLRFLSVNEAFQTHYGYSVPEMEAMRLPDLYPEEEKEQIVALIPSLRGYHNIGEWHHRRKDGSLITIVACSHDILYKGRVGRVAVLTDISDRKIAEERMRLLNIELEKRVSDRTSQLELANKELESFSYSVSHDLRAPLRAISGFAEIISRRYAGELNQEARHYFGNVIHASERMGRLIDDLLTYSRLGRGAIQRVPIALNDLFREIVKSFEHRVAEEGATINVPEDLPTVMADQSLLEQIFANLLQNALTYHKPGATGVVDVAWRRAGGDVVVSVHDNGIGIPEEYHERIFNVFQRLHSDEEYPGTGIGLSTVKKSVGLMGGNIVLQSEVGKGSTFSVTIPGV